MDFLHVCVLVPLMLYVVNSCYASIVVPVAKVAGLPVAPTTGWTTETLVTFLATELWGILCMIPWWMKLSIALFIWICCPNTRNELCKAWCWILKICRLLGGWAFQYMNEVYDTATHAPPAATGPAPAKSPAAPPAATGPAPAKSRAKSPAARRKAPAAPPARGKSPAAHPVNNRRGKSQAGIQVPECLGSLVLARFHNTKYKARVLSIEGDEYLIEFEDGEQTRMKVSNLEPYVDEE